MGIGITNKAGIQLCGADSAHPQGKGAITKKQPTKRAKYLTKKNIKSHHRHLLIPIKCADPVLNPSEHWDVIRLRTS